MPQREIKNIAIRVLKPWTWASFIIFWFLVSVFILAIAGDEGTAGNFSLLAEVCYQSLTVLIFPWFLLLKTGLFTANWWTLFASLIFCSLLYGFVIAQCMVVIKNWLRK